MANVAFYRCNACGNVLALIKSWDGTVTCCEQTMTKLEANTTDAERETHVPAITRENDKLKVQVGSVSHSMTKEHHIEWIALESGPSTEFTHLHSGSKPKAKFIDVPTGTVYACCNLHGLWKIDL